MELNLNLKNTISWKIKISEDYTEIIDDNISLNLDLLEIHQIQEPYIKLPLEKELESIKSSIKSKGFLHPILVLIKDNNYILLDGSYRIQALKELNCNLVPVIIVKDAEMEKDAWVKILKEKSPHYKTIYKKISPTQRKRLIHQEFDLLSIDSLIEYQNNPSIIAVYNDGKHIHVFSNKDPYSNRLEHIKLKNSIDDAINSQNKDYSLISKIKEESLNID